MICDFFYITFTSLPICYVIMAWLFFHFSYNTFIQILTDAQPTYLPPIKTNRRNTFVLENNDTIMRKLHHTIENNRNLHDYSGSNDIENKRTIEMDSRIEYYNNSRKYDNNDPSNNDSELNKDSFVYQDDGRPQPNNQNSGERKDLLDRNSRQENLLSPRRKWYESEESWRKRKRKTKPRRQLLRRRWEYSAPVISLRESADLGKKFCLYWTLTFIFELIFKPCWFSHLRLPLIFKPCSDSYFTQESCRTRVVPHKSRVAQEESCRTRVVSHKSRAAQESCRTRVLLCKQ